MGIIMTAFDQQLVGQLYATLAFQRDFGYKYHGRYIVKASWQTALSMCGPLGQALGMSTWLLHPDMNIYVFVLWHAGAFAVACPMEWYGRRKTLATCVVMTASFVFIQFFTRSLSVLLVDELLGGLTPGVCN